MNPTYHRLTLKAANAPDRVLIFNDATRATKRMEQFRRDAQSDLKIGGGSYSSAQSKDFVEVRMTPQATMPHQTIPVWRADLELDVPFDQ